MTVAACPSPTRIIGGWRGPVRNSYAFSCQLRACMALFVRLCSVLAFAFGLIVCWALGLRLRPTLMNIFFDKKKHNKYKYLTKSLLSYFLLTKKKT